MPGYTPSHPFLASTACKTLTSGNDAAWACYGLDWLLQCGWPSPCAAGAGLALELRRRNAQDIDHSSILYLYENGRLRTSAVAARNLVHFAQLAHKRGVPLGTPGLVGVAQWANGVPPMVVIMKLWSPSNINNAALDMRRATYTAKLRGPVG